MTVLSVTGDIDVEQICDELTGFYQGKFTRNVIWDFSNARGKNLSGNDLQMIVSHSKELSHVRKDGKTAFVISTSLGYGLGRMYDSLAQVADHPIKYGVFRNYDEAVDWISNTDTD